MQTLIIYDNTGKIFYQVSGDVIVPDGLQHILVEIPSGFYVENVNVQTKEPVLKEYPKSETEILQEQHETMKMSLAEMSILAAQQSAENKSTQEAIAELSILLATAPK